VVMMFGVQDGMRSIVLSFAYYESGLVC